VNGLGLTERADLQFTRRVNDVPETIVVTRKYTLVYSLLFFCGGLLSFISSARAQAKSNSRSIFYSGGYLLYFQSCNTSDLPAGLILRFSIDSNLGCC
jgi:hypothetical protein